MFEAMNEAIQRDSVRLIMRARLTAEDPAPRRRVPTQLLEGRGSSGWSRASAATRTVSAASSPKDAETRSTGDTSSATPYRKKHVPGRNEPCWCGSGKKYKNCHLRQDEQESM